MSYKEKVEFNEADLGSNKFVNSRYVIYYENRNGKFENLFTLEENDLDFLLTTESIRDESGRHLGRIWRNKVIQPEEGSLTSGREYETKRTPNKFWLKNGETLILSVRAETNGLWIINGIFHVKVGKKERIVKIEVTDSETIISSQIISKDPVTHEEIISFVNPIQLSNNEVKNSGGIKISSTENGISFSLGFPQETLKQRHYKP